MNRKGRPLRDALRARLPRASDDLNPSAFGPEILTYFECPACGRSFKVAKPTSERIYCSRYCREALSA